jgi:anion-transporting  ArsA/GET3 family ATPase
MVPTPSSIPPARLHVVTGKGGTGKTTLAAALALALARDGRRVLVVEVEARQGLAQVFDTGHLPYTERKVATAPGRGEVWALAVDAEEALLDYLEMFYNLKRAGRALRRMGAIDFATTIAPGMRDVLLTGKVKEAVTRREHGHRVYDAVVLDAPPTGRISRFLNATREAAKLAKVGPIKTQSDGVATVLRSEQTAVHLVTLLEEMPVQETLDAGAELTGSGIPLGVVLVNQVRAPLLPKAAIPAAARGEIDIAEVTAGLKRAGLAVPADLLDGLVAETVEHAGRVVAERRLRRRLGQLGRPVLELPLLADGVDVGGLYELAEILAERVERRG